jgi:hypothetical protein
MFRPALRSLVLRALRTLRGPRGYWIEHVPPGLLQAEEGDFGVVYHEGSRELMFLGVQRPKPAADILFIPPERSWNSRVEPWAQNRRAEILARLLRDPLVSRCEIRTSSLR